MMWRLNADTSVVMRRHPPLPLPPLCAMWWYPGQQQMLDGLVDGCWMVLLMLELLSM